MVHWRLTGAALLLICIYRLGFAWGIPPPYESTSWTAAHATFYGGLDASGTQGGACGYGDLTTQGYGTATAALSPALFNNGLTCGACFEIKCNFASGGYSTKWCHKNAGSITITGTNLCPANFARTKDGWCNPPHSHFDMSYPAFAQLAQRVAGIIPVQYRRVGCIKRGGLRFQIDGNPWFNLVLVYNVGGAGSLNGLAIKGDKTNTWFTMSHNWGQMWQDHNKLVGQSLCFKVTAASGTTLYVYSLTGPKWTHGSTFYSSQQFDNDDVPT
ncbi:unnamed protein product [Calypogeia fissa]